MGAQGLGAQRSRPFHQPAKKARLKLTLQPRLDTGPFAGSSPW